ncbi:MAG: hypothetical protein EPN20_10965, partial [Magnetospirillum sp.]
MRRRLLPRLIHRALSMPLHQAIRRTGLYLFHFLCDRTGRFGHLLRLAASLPPHVALAKGGRLLIRLIDDRRQAIAKRRQSSYPPLSSGRLGSRLERLDFSPVAANAEILKAMVPLYLKHRFDLLGSGWVRVAPDESYGGFGTHRYHVPATDVVAEHQPGNRRRAKTILGLIADPGYRPIDWHVDFKSGYRWSPSTWGRSIAYGHLPGVDVKVPWELARMQHLPHLAYAHGLSPDPALPAEFRHQILDFLGSNPPGWGVNWACPMDVAIRAVNMVVAWDLFRVQGVQFDDAFEAELAAAMLAHGRHVVEYLEWHDEHRANHYLADIAGLTFIAAYLPRSPESDLWLAFAVQQLEIEIKRQFTPDGANFEASTSYHRLSAEMALHAVALILGLPEERRAALVTFDAGLWPRSGMPQVAPGPISWPPFSPQSLDRLAGVAGFAAAVTKPSGEIVQVGDNDSGRFLKLSPLFDLTSDGPRERHLDLRGLIASAKGLFELDLTTSPETAMETAVVAALAGGRRLQVAKRAVTVPDRPVVMGECQRLHIIPPDPSALAGLEPLAYPDFGLFLWKNARSFISIRCGPIGQNGNGGHAHNDQLAVEIEIDGIAWSRDPGTFVYTPDLDARNRYRSALAHFVPRHGRNEPARFISPFRLEDRARAEVLRFGSDFVGVHHGFGEPIHRRVSIE